MSDNIVVDDKNITMWYYPEDKILHHQIHQFFSGETFRNVFTRAAELFEQYDADKYISDDRAVVAWKKEDMNWSDNNFLPRMKKAGWKYWAIISPENTVGQMTLNDIAATFTKGGIDTHIFTSIDAALHWLRNV